MPSSVTYTLNNYLNALEFNYTIVFLENNGQTPISRFQKHFFLF